jgi:hypothetical protein
MALFPSALREFSRQMNHQLPKPMTLAVVVRPIAADAHVKPM